MSKSVWLQQLAQYCTLHGNGGEVMLLTCQVGVASDPPASICIRLRWQLTTCSTQQHTAAGACKDM
jgi:hypothetical protein